jgi:hypothetical protein
MNEKNETRRRIIRADGLNWAIQEWQPGGDIIERGRFTGQVKKAKWKMPESFFRTLTDAARSMFHDIVADGFTGVEVAALVDSAEERVKAHVSSMLEKQKDDVLIGILQERGYSVTDGRKGRKTLADDAAPEDDHG